MILRQNNNLIEAAGLIQPIDFTAVEENNVEFINDLEVFSIVLDGEVDLPNQTPFEIHPYKNLINLENFDKYIIGTFPPVSYLYDTVTDIISLSQPNNGRQIPRPGFSFYHGNRSALWRYLLTHNEFDQLPPAQEEIPTYLINLLTNMGVNYGDIIDATQRELNDNRYTASDNKLYNIVINENLISHIFQNKRAKYLLFNTASIYGIQGLKLNAEGRVCLRKTLNHLIYSFEPYKNLG